MQSCGDPDQGTGLVKEEKKTTKKTNTVMQIIFQQDQFSAQRMNAQSVCLGTAQQPGLLQQLLQHHSPGSWDADTHSAP